MTADRAVRGLAITTAVLAVVGLASVASALFHSEGVRQGAFLDNFLRQVLWVVIGAAAGFAIFRIPYARVVPFAFPLYVLGLAALVAVLVFGTRINGATRWFRLGPVSLQPSEFAKLFALLALARSLSWSDRMKNWKGFCSAWLLAGLPLVLIQMQPDLTTALLLAPATVVMLWTAGARWQWWAVLGVLALVGGAVLWSTGIIRDYQKGRVTAFVQKLGLDAGADTAMRTRAAEREAYQGIQAEIAIGSGGLLGKGFLSGTQNQLAVIPMSSSDFIFAVIAEEWGFVGSIGILALYAVLTWHLFWIAHSTEDPFGRLFSIGFAVHLGAQAIINIAMATGIFPVVGIPLPLVSAGGSSIVATLLGLGLVARIGLSGAPAFSRG